MLHLPLKLGIPPRVCNRSVSCAVQGAPVAELCAGTAPHALLAPTKPVAPEFCVEVEKADPHNVSFLLLF